MVQLQRIDAHLDTLTIELYQVNTCVGCITQWWARLNGFVASPSPSPEASKDEDVVDGDDDNKDKNASSSSDDETTSRECSFGMMRVVMYLGGELA